MTNVLRIARRAVGPLLLLALVMWLDPIAILRRLSSANVVAVLPVIAALVAMHVVAAISWRRLVAAIAGVHLDLGHAIRLYYAAQAWGAATPANLGADVYRVTALDGAAPRASLAAAVMWQRAASIAALLVLGLAGAILVAGESAPGQAMSEVAASAPAVITAGIGLAILAFALIARRRRITLASP